MFWNHFFIVGTQKDRRDEEQDTQVKGQMVTTQQGKRMADELKLSKFMETSALKDQQVIVTFEAIQARHTLESRKYVKFYWFEYNLL